MIYDSHIHVGQFRDIYTSPKELVSFLDKVGVEKFAVSSTSVWEEDYNKVINEVQALISLAKERVYPVLWITPTMLHGEGIEQMLNSGITWRCVKIHGVHPWDNESIQKVADVAHKLHVPMLLHTGGFEQCEAGQYLSLITKNPDVIFVLAHARPIEQTIEVMQQCSNAWADTAFTPVENVKALIQRDFSDRVLWGTDYPIQRVYYKDADQEQIYNNRVKEIREVMSETDFKKIIMVNFNRLFIT